MALTALGASAIQAGMNFVGSALGLHQQGAYNAKEAQKDRDFQERMYNQQVQDNINFWKMQTDYANPSAELNRIREAGLNPLLYYGNGGQSATVSQPQAASAPSGAQASRSFNNPIDMANLALLNAQVENIKADTDEKRAGAEERSQHAKNLEYDVMFKRLSQQIDLSIKHANLGKLFAETDQLRELAYNTGMMTVQSTLSMIQAREYEIKRFNWDVESFGKALEYQWYEAKSGRIAANAQMKSAFAAILNAKANWNLSNAQIGQIGLNMSQSRQMFPLLMENQRNVNWSQVQDRIFKGVQISNAQRDGFMKDMENYFMSHGVPTDSWLMKLAGPFVLPTIKINDDMFGRPQYKPLH